MNEPQTPPPFRSHADEVAWILKHRRELIAAEADRKSAMPKIKMHIARKAW